MIHHYLKNGVITNFEFESTLYPNIISLLRAHVGEWITFDGETYLIIVNEQNYIRFLRENKVHDFYIDCSTLRIIK